MSNGQHNKSGFNADTIGKELDKKLDKYSWATIFIIVIILFFVIRSFSYFRQHNRDTTLPSSQIESLEQKIESLEEAIQVLSEE